MLLSDVRLGRRVRAVRGPAEAMVRPRSVALLGADLPGLRPDLRVTVGDGVTAGQSLFADRKHPEVTYAAPANGRVAEIDIGPGRRLSALILDLDPDDGSGKRATAIAVETGDAARRLLLARGFWPAFRSRPFGRVPVPDAVPTAIFVHAMAGCDGAPDPAALLGETTKDFSAGLRLLTLLTAGPVFACVPSGLTLPNPAPDRIYLARFAPRLRAALASYHISQLHGPTRARPVWTIGWQDVAAIGHLLSTGQYRGERVVAIHTGRTAAPKLTRTILGASLPDLLATGTSSGSLAKTISGPLIGGQEALWLGRHDTQAALVDRPRASILSRFYGPSHGAPRPILPHAGLDAVLPPGMPCVPFLRALTVGDLDFVERLGGRDLIEEDLALASHLCTSGTDYGARLRRMLDEMEAAE